MKKIFLETEYLHCRHAFAFEGNVELLPFLGVKKSGKYELEITENPNGNFSLKVYNDELYTLFDHKETYKCVQICRKGLQEKFPEFKLDTKYNVKVTRLEK